MNTSVIKGQSPEFWTALREIHAGQDSRMYLQMPRDIEYFSFSFADTSFEDRSCAVLLDGRPVAALIAALGTRPGGVTEISAYGTPVVYFEAQELTPADQRRLANALEEIVGGFASADSAFFRFSDVQPGVLATHLLSKGAEVNLSFWQLIDLRKSEEELKSDVRKSYKNLINKGGNEYQYRVFEKDCTATDLDAFRELHVQAAGRSTRNAESWNMQLQKIQAGEAFLVIGFKNETPVSGAYFINDGRTSYYGSAASPDKDDAYGSSHALIWHAVRFAKAKGCSHLDLGQVLFPNQRCVIDIHARPVLDGSHELASERELGISRFKKGFGGTTVARLDLLWKPGTSSKNTTSA